MGKLMYPGSLHNHTDYSNLRLRDAIIRVPDLIDRAIELGQEVVAFTEHESVSNAIKIEEYYQKVKKDNPNFKVILGNEIYLCRDGLNEDTYNKESDIFYHYILLAKNAKGHEQIREISTKAWSHSFKTGTMTRVPTWYSDLIEIISKEPGNVIGSSACLGSQLSKSILAYYNNPSDTNFYQNHIVLWCTEMERLFGKGNFYLELQPAPSEEQKIINKELLKLSKQLDIPYIITTDSHYLKKEDASVHKAFLNAQDGDREVDTFYAATYLQSTEEVEQYLDYLTEEELQTAYRNILDIKNKCEDYSLFRELKIPSLAWKTPTPINETIKSHYIDLIPTLKDFFNSTFDGDRIMAQLIINKFESDNRLQNEKHYQTIESNLKAVKISSEVNKTHWSAYFLNLQKTIEVCWNSGTLVGCGRGSGVGFLLLYFLDIIQINPLWETTQCFEWRFLNPDRVSVLDIDTDIEGGRRAQVLQGLRDFYGQNNVANVVTFGTEKSKSALQTACFKKGTLVDTKNGEIPIESIQSGELVKTLDGYEPVIIPTIYQGIPNYKVKTKNSLNKEFYCTADHEILTIEAYRRVSGSSCASLVKKIFPELSNFSPLNSVYEKYVRNIKKITPTWKPVSQIHNKHDFGLTLINTTIEDIKTIHWTNDFKQRYGIGISENIEINEDFCELVGIWIAEGSLNKANNAVSFTIHQNEEFLKLRIIELMWKIFQLDNVCITTRLNSKAVTITYSSSQLAQFFFELFGNTGIWKEKRADNTYHYLTQWDKKVPSILMNIDPYLQLQIIKGWFLGDGYARSKEQTGSQIMKCTTVSKQLAKDMLVLFHRNFINPSVDIEQRSLTQENQCDCYNLSLYGDYGNFFYNIKYTTQENYNAPIKLPLDIRRKDDLPVIYKDKLYMKTKLEISVDSTIDKEQEVYCLKMPNENFSVNNTIVHNCRGLGINNDEALYLSSLIPADRGQTRTLQECYYGDKEKGMDPIPAFVKAMDNDYPELWNVAQKIEGLVCRVGEHAGGVIFVDEPFTKSTALMKVPNGDVVTQFDLHDCEKSSLIKIDLLSVECLDKIHNCIDLLAEYGYVDKDLTLRQQYEKLIGIYNLERQDLDMWKMIWNHKILSLFQMEQQSGIQGIDAIHPKSVDELAVLNSVIRLMAPDQESERPLDTWVRNRQSLQYWIKEMQEYGLSNDEIDWLSHHSAITEGICESQEGLMSLVQEPRLGGHTLGFADRCRKAIAKKQGKLFQECEQEFYDEIQKQNLSLKLAHYVWDVLLRVQRGYSFNRSHCLSYSLIALQEMNLCFKYPIIYWNTACLITDSGTEEAGTDYDKIATAIGKMRNANVHIELPEINSSGYGFVPNEKQNIIYCGFKSLVNMGTDSIEAIIANRPYVSPKDFLFRVKPNKQTMISLIKGGAFDNMMERRKCMAWYLWETCDKKTNLTMNNMPTLIKHDLIPRDNEALTTGRRIFEFNRYLKVVCKYDIVNYKLDSRALEFLSEINYPVEGELLNIKIWDKYYQKQMDVFRNWMSQNKAQILDDLNFLIFKDEWEKYALGSISAWEMTAVCFYYHEHELAHINKSQYGIVDFDKLPEEPEIECIKYIRNKPINIFKLVRICGTCIAKNKTKGIVTLLTTSGVVNVKFRKEYFALFDRQISAFGEDGKKHVVESSWFKRGNKIVVMGIRSGDTFVAKKYANSIGHQLYKINSISPSRELTLQGERAQGEAEDEEI